MSSTSAKNPSSETYWRLLAIGIDPDRASPELYGLIREGETDVPLTANDRILFFKELARAREVLNSYGSSLPADRIDIDKPFFWCDIAQTLYFLSVGGTDADASVLRSINVLLDLVKATGVKMDDARRRALHDIANYCTMSKDLTKYFDEDGEHSSRELIDAVLWCVGAVVVRSRIV